MCFRFIATAVFFLFVLSGCTGGSEEVSPQTTPTTVPAPTTTSEPEPTSTTEPEPISTPPPEPARTSTTVPAVSDEEAAAAVHTRFMTEIAVRDERVDGDVERRIALAERVTTGALLARIQGRPGRIADGAEIIVGPGYLSNIVALEVEGDVVNIVDCSQDRTEGYNAYGDLTTAADDFFKLRSTRLVRIDGDWFVEEFFTGGDDRCTPGDS